MQTAGVGGNWVTSCDSEQKAENSLRASVSSSPCVSGPKAMHLPWWWHGSQPSCDDVSVVLSSFFSDSSALYHLVVAAGAQVNLQIITFTRCYLERYCTWWG